MFTKFGLPPTDCAENFTPECYNTLGSFGGSGYGFYITPHLGNQNYGQYSTYYNPLNLGNGMANVIEIQPGAPPIANASTDPAVFIDPGIPIAAQLKIAPALPNTLNDLFTRAKNYAQANPLIALAVGGGVAYLVFVRNNFKTMTKDNKSTMLWVIGLGAIGYYLYKNHAPAAVAPALPNSLLNLRLPKSPWNSYLVQTPQGTYSVDPMGVHETGGIRTGVRDLTPEQLLNI